jgi:hypothetical protein
MYLFSMKMTKKQLEELVDKTGALVGSKSMSPKYGNSLVGSYDVTDDHVEKTTQDRSYETPYRRYFGEDDLSNHPLFDISKKAKSYTQFIEMAKKYKPKMGDDEIEDAAGLFGFRKDKKRIVKEKDMNESVLKFSDGVKVNTSGELRPLNLPDGWYVVGEGKLIPVKDKEEAKSLIKMMTEKPIKENAHSLLEKIVKVKTKDDVQPKMVKSNNYVDKAISHLKSSMGEIEKYKTNPKVSGVYKSLEKTIKSLESIVDKIEDRTELMDSINEGVETKTITIDDLKRAIKMAQETVLTDLRSDETNPKYSEDEILNTILGSNNLTTKLPFDEEIKRELRKLYSGSIYDKIGKIDDRIDQLFNIHNKWLDMAKKRYSANEIADKLFKYEKSLKNG